jgi:colanic acid biosynthesis glycosyl transferase WcaI
MRILFLSLYFKPDVAANAVVISELAEELVKEGHEITVVTSVPHYASNEIPEEYKGKLIQKNRMPGMKVFRTYLYASPSKEKFIVRLLNYVSFNVLSTITGLFSGPQDVIFAPSPPLTIGLSAAVIGFFKGTPYVYNVQDINPDVLIKLGIMKNPFFISFSKLLEKFVYKHAKHITVLSQGFKKNLLRKDVNPEKITVIPNFVDTDFIRPLPKENSFRKRFGLEDNFIILYAGNLGHSQSIEVLLESAVLLEEYDDMVFVIVGNGSREEILKNLAKEFGTENVIFIPFQPRADVPEIYAAADISAVLLKKDIALDSVPSKTYTIMASARPIAAAVDKGSDVWNLITDVECGLCVEPESPNLFAEAVETLYNNQKLRENFAVNGRKFVEENHTKQVIGKRYHKLFQALTEN